MLYQIAIVLIILSYFIVSPEAKRTKQLISNGLCTSDQYRCKNDRCIKRSWFCDGNNDCGDNSDEDYCQLKLTVWDYKRSVYTSACPSHYSFSKCPNAEYQCIPSLWKCDGVADCKNGYDEIGCLNDVEKITGSISAREEAISWIRSQTQNADGNKRYGMHASRVALALFFSNPNYFNGSNTVGNEVAYEVENQILASMIRDQSTNSIPITKLALYIHALLVTCIDPRNFYGVDLVAKLRLETEKQATYTSPLVILALCNAKDKMTEKDIEKVTNAFNNVQRPLWKNIQALALMALSCINEKSHTSSVSPSVFKDMSFKLKQNQFANGSFGNIQTTALIVQALFASGKEDNDWDMDETIKFLVKNQKSDGSYGSFLNTYYVLPVLHYKSLLNISSSHCDTRSSKKDSDVLFDLNQKIGKKISVKYSLIYGGQNDFVRTLILRIIEGSTFFDIMNLAKSLDEKYSFEYNLLESKPYVYSVSGLEDDPESEIYWFLYKINNADLLNSKAIHSSPMDVIPKDGEEYAMWYKNGHWSENSETVFAQLPATDSEKLNKQLTQDNVTKSDNAVKSSPHRPLFFKV